MNGGLSPDREELVRQLREYESRWPDEAPVAARFAAFIADNPRCFERGLETGHVTGSAWVVNRAGTHVLLTHHKKLGMWVQLGGHADGDGDLLRVARREAEEESGLAGLVPLGPGIFDIDVHRIPARGAEAEHLHWDIRHAFRAAGSEAYRVSEESHDLAWVEIASLLRLAYPVDDPGGFAPPRPCAVGGQVGSPTTQGGGARPNQNRTSLLQESTKAFTTEESMLRMARKWLAGGEPPGLRRA